MCENSHKKLMICNDLSRLFDLQIEQKFCKLIILLFTKVLPIHNSVSRQIQLCQVANLQWRQKNCIITWKRYSEEEWEELKVILNVLYSLWMVRHWGVGFYVGYLLLSGRACIHMRGKLNYSKTETLQNSCVII